MSEAEAATVRDPDTMTEAQLRDEVWFWRTEAAASLSARRFDLEAARKKKWAGIGLLKAEVERLGVLLRSALFGELHDRCFACDHEIRPGDACISDVNEGEMHAMCPVEGRPQTVFPGDKIYLEPEAIVWEGDGPKPDHLVAFAHERLYTTAQIAAKVAQAGERAAA